jgi:hypothetical protein
MSVSAVCPDNGMTRIDHRIANGSSARNASASDSEVGG